MRVLKDHIKPFGKFIGARLATMVIEVGGVWLLVEQLHMNDMLGKFATQFVVLVLNYIFSKFLVFTTERSEEREKMTINETIAAVRPLDQQIMEKAKKRWTVCKAFTFPGKDGGSDHTDRRDHREI